jgi:uncharacterized protein with PIN domain
VTETAPVPKFIVDHMLGSLARWLRMIGYDTIYDKSLEDADIARVAHAEGRFILTRDKELSTQPGAFLLEDADLDAQLKAIAGKFGLKFHEELIRCSTCNGELADLPKEQAKGKVPEGAHASNEKFWRCSKCEKIYWKGSHWLGINERLKKLGLA